MKNTFDLCLNRGGKNLYYSFKPCFRKTRGRNPFDTDNLRKNNTERLPKDQCWSNYYFHDNTQTWFIF